VILSPYPGQVVEVKVNSGDVVAAGTPIAMLAPTADEAADTLGVIYVSPTDGKRIRPGMEAEIVPSIYRREEYGFIRAKVVSVSPVPATAEGMRRVVKNDRLVTQLSGGGAPFEVRVHFDRDASVPSGLQWSASKGPPAAIAAGNLIDAAILVDRKPIANLLVPGIDTMLGLKGGG
jgi:HlyD family secretion protein